MHSIFSLSLARALTERAAASGALVLSHDHSPLTTLAQQLQPRAKATSSEGRTVAINDAHMPPGASTCSSLVGLGSARHCVGHLPTIRSWPTVMNQQKLS